MALMANDCQKKSNLRLFTGSPYPHYGKNENEANETGMKTFETGGSKNSDLFVFCIFGQIKQLRVVNNKNLKSSLRPI